MTDLDLRVNQREPRGRTDAPGCKDANALRHLHDNQLEVSIGRKVRDYRRMHGMSIMDLARAAGLSLGMMSKIENGIISASLTTLQALSHALAVPLSSLLRRSEEPRNACYMKAGAGVEIEQRRTRTGDQYRLLSDVNSLIPDVSVEPYLITLNNKEDRFPLVQHTGMAFLYLLEGELNYRHGKTLYRMLPGDSLIFDTYSPHGPDQLTKPPVRFLWFISYRQGNSI